VHGWRRPLGADVLLRTAVGSLTAGVFGPPGLTANSQPQPLSPGTNTLLLATGAPNGTYTVKLALESTAAQQLACDTGLAATLNVERTGALDEDGPGDGLPPGGRWRPARGPEAGVRV
jgi:hypothetical protein